MPNITYVPRSSIYPRFGVCYRDGRIEIREDLPQCVKEFLVVHETYHATDTETVWWKREIKANVTGLMAHPLGFIVTAFMSLSPYRLKYYLQRFRDKK
jgi:hypothetical protein